MNNLHGVYCRHKRSTDMALNNGMRACASGFAGFAFQPTMEEITACPKASLRDVMQSCVPDEMHTVPGGVWRTVFDLIMANTTTSQKNCLHINQKAYKSYVSSTVIRIPAANYFTNPGGIMNSEDKAMMQTCGEWA
jgi:hypothetical protein